MELLFRIADTFTDSLAKLTAEDQKRAKTTAFDLQMNPKNQGLNFHRLDRIKGKDFWSVRVSDDIRIIVHQTDESMLLCYVDRHDKAYSWAERRKLETHPKTGAAQLVEIREEVQVVLVPKYVEVEPPAPEKPRPFAQMTEDDLLSYGVPPGWLDDVRQATEDSILELASHLPAEASEAVLNLATGTVPAKAQVAPDIDPFEHPDAQRRFRVMHDVEELELALEYPWEKWMVFLHPAQRELVERHFNGPARVSGSAGTGKTIVALHRAVFLARTNSDARVLLTTFSDTLANALQTKLRRLIGNEPRIGERLEVHSLNALGQRLYQLHFRHRVVPPRETIRELINGAAADVEGQTFSPQFLLTEWEQVVDAWQLETWEAYRDVARLGRKTRLAEKQRSLLWATFEGTRKELAARHLVTTSQMFTRLAERLPELERPPYEFTVVDEAQDVTVAQLRFLAALGGDRPDSLFFAGDLGQRIFQQPFSWKALGVDVRGRSRTLRINYRTSHQIRRLADRLLGPEVSDVDGNTEDRRGAVSVFNGAEPQVLELNGADEEVQTVALWLADRTAEGVLPHEIGVFVRSEAELKRAAAAVEAAGLRARVLDETVSTTSGHVSVCTMHLAKGLEFRAVAIMACDDEIIPSQERIETVTDEADLQDVYETERQLLYVACTRARDYLLVTSSDVPSEFLEDLRG